MLKGRESTKRNRRECVKGAGKNMLKGRKSMERSRKEYVKGAEEYGKEQERKR